MKQHRHLWGAALAMAALSAQAGNIPQYYFSADGAPYSAIEGTPIECSWSAGGTVLIYPDGEKAIYESAEGFDIGFEFKVGGHWMDQFIVSSSGILYFLDSAYPFSSGMFRVGMSPVSGGVESADISYATTGEEGKRVCTIQYANAVLAESSTPHGMYHLQIRLYEEDNHIELAFQELRAPSGNLQGFDVSLRGWDSEDVVVYTAEDIDQTPTLSKYKRAYMLDLDSYVHWNASDSGEQRSASYRFKPETNTTAPKGAPVNLTLSQNGNSLDVSVRRGRDARATVVMWSTEPITAADLPSDGETFLAGPDETLGNAHLIYYGPSNDIKLNIPDIEDGKDYYVAAISANGYPAYNVDNMAQEMFTTSQPAPYLLRAYSTGTNSMKLDCGANNRVIIASTPTACTGYKKGYCGLFGIPAADAAVGDEIEGGGTVIYVGEPTSIDNIPCSENQIMFFRAWTVASDRVSDNHADSYAIPDVSLPYAPGVENYPFGELIPGWTSTPTGEDFAPWVRRYYSDDHGVYGVAPAGYEPTSLSTPELPLDGPVRVTFEYAMETQRDAAATPDSGGVILPQGFEPGWFGQAGYLRVKTGGTIHKTFTSYDGKMEGFDSSGYHDDSSTFEEMSVDIPAQGGLRRITFEVSNEKASRIYFRNIVVTPLAENPEAPKNAPTEVKVSEYNAGILTINCKRGDDAEYTMVLFSETPMTDAELPADGHIYTVGEKLGNATVLYFGTDELIECMTTYTINNVPQFIFAEYDTDYYVRAISGSSNPLFNTENVNDVIYHSNPDPNSGVDGINASSDRLEVTTLTGIRLNVSNLAELPAGLYIVNGMKYLVK